MAGEPEVADDGADVPAAGLTSPRYVPGDLDATHITPESWRRLDLRMPKADGSVAELCILRPLWWIEETGARPGVTIDLGMHEIGISGPAEVLYVGPCEADSRDNPAGTSSTTSKSTAPTPTTSHTSAC